MGAAPLGVISGGDQKRGCCICANPLHGHQFGRSFTNQSIKLLVELGGLSLESRIGPVLTSRTSIFLIDLFQLVVPEQLPIAVVE